MIFKQISFSKIISQYSKLSNVAERYNGLQSKSQSFQNQYNKVLQNNTSNIGKYLQSLNGAKASLPGYIKYLVTTKASTVALTVATTVMKTALITGAVAGISLFVQEISKGIHAQEEARQKAIELTNAYKEQKDSLDSQIEKYKGLKETLDNGNLSTDETRSIKEQLLEIQKSLIESYGNEASNIDLVNGKYREQLGLLSELSKEKATDYVAENRDVFEKAKKELEKIRSYQIGSLFKYDIRKGKTDVQKQLYDYVKSYSDLFEIRDIVQPTFFNDVYAPTLYVKANVENAEELMRQFYVDLEQYGKDNNIDVSGMLNNIPGQLRKARTDELKEYKTIYDEFMKAEVVRNDTLRPLYLQSIKAVEDYNKALSSGEGVAEAKANLDSIQQSVQNATAELEGSQEIFNDIYDGINKNDERAYNLEQTFKNDKAVKEYAEQLYGLLDIDLKAINFKDNVESPGEEAFGSLIDILGLSEDEVQKLIDKLVKLGYVQGQVQDAPPKTPDTFSSKLTNSTDSLDKFQSSVKFAADTYTTLLSGNYSSSELLDSIQAINKAASDMGKSINWEDIGSLDELNDKIEEISKTYADSILSGTGIENSDFGKMLANIVQESYQSEAALKSLNTQIDSLQSAYNNLTDIVDSYNKTGYITFDLLQTLLEMEPQYLSCLIDEHGQLQLNQEAMQALANQRLNDARTQIIEQTITELGELQFKKEKTAIEGTTMALENGAETITSYEERLLDFIPIAELTTEEFIKLSNAINGAVSNGVSDEDIDEVFQNAEKKFKFVKDMFDGNLKDMLDGFSTAKVFTDALDKELTALDKKMETGYIDFNDYIQARLKLIEAYYKQGKLSADEYYSYLEKHYETQLSYMDKVVSAVTRRIDTEIDALKQQKEDVESLYAVQIESLEKQKTLLEEANQKRQRQIDLQKALYDLERAKNQRTKLVYSEDKGMHYVADEQSISDAQKSADDAKYENQIAEIERSISKLENARDQETSAIDAMISSLEEYKDAWSDVTSTYKEEQEDLLAAQFFGADWESKILNGRLDVLKDFKEQYIRIQQEIAAAAAQETVNGQVGATGKDNSGSEGDQKKKKKALETLKTPIQRLSSSLASSLTSSLPTQHQSILSHIQTYGSGTNNAKKGLNLVGEDGAEAYFDNHGHVAIVTKPTLIPMEGGEVVKNERDTKQLLDLENLAPADTIALAGYSDAAEPPVRYGVSHLSGQA